MLPFWIRRNLFKTPVIINCTSLIVSRAAKKEGMHSWRPRWIFPYSLNTVANNQNKLGVFHKMYMSLHAIFLWQTWHDLKYPSLTSESAATAAATTTHTTTTTIYYYYFYFYYQCSLLHCTTIDILSEEYLVISCIFIFVSFSLIELEVDKAITNSMQMPG